MTLSQEPEEKGGPETILNHGLDLCEAESLRHDRSCSGASHGVLGYALGGLVLRSQKRAIEQPHPVQSVIITATCRALNVS